jgi:hypothetical protein
MDYFREYISTKKKRIEAHKSNVEKMLMKEKDLDSVFIDQVVAELERQENEEKNEKNEKK